MKKLWVGIGIVVVVALAVVLIVTQTIREPAEIKIGATLPLTGNAAVWGSNAREGVNLAIERINALGGVNGKQIKVIYEDSQALPEKGVPAIRKLIKVDKVLFLKYKSWVIIQFQVTTTRID